MSRQQRGRDHVPARPGSADLESLRIVEHGQYHGARVPASDQRRASVVRQHERGLQNLYENVGADARLMMRDWTLAILMDDLVPGISAKYQQPSWNLRQMVSPYGSAVKTVTFANATQATYTLAAGGTSFTRFGIATGGEAY